MRIARCFGTAALAVLFVALTARAQEAPRPGPEHELLKKWEGTWDITMMKDVETKGTATFKMELGGLWLVGSLEGELGGAKYSGKLLETYDPKKEKYVGVWIDSRSTSPLIMEGSYDGQMKRRTVVAKAPSVGSTSYIFAAVSVWRDDDTVDFSYCLMPEGSRISLPEFTITYKRRK
jgi:hypothetical protein